MKEHYTNFCGKGIYECSKCGNKLFESEAKFKSGTRWPSFQDAKKRAMATKSDHSYGMERTEIICTNCGQHLDHVFDDGKKLGDKHPETGNRYCVLSKSLKFAEIKKKE